MGQRDDIFYSWQCVSLVTESNTTIDFLIKDETMMLCFLRKMHQLVYNSDSDCMKAYKLMKLKMKISYGAWQRSQTMTQFVFGAI